MQGGIGFAGSEQLRQVGAAQAPLGPPPRTACHVLPFGFYAYQYALAMADRLVFQLFFISSVILLSAKLQTF